MLNELMKSANDFTKNAKDFTKNPLGIIALFISLIYGFACLVLGAGSSALDRDQKWPIVVFLVTFPFAILGSFLYLVINHVNKLYGPSDFKDEKYFIETLGIGERNKRIEIEAESIIEDANTDVQIFPEPIQSTIETGIPKIEIIEGPFKTRFDAMKKYQAAEDMVMSKLEAELQSPIQRQVLFTNGSINMEFDGITIFDGRFYGIEVKYTKTGNMPLSVINMIKRVMIQMLEFNKSVTQARHFTFLLAIAHPGVDPEILEKLKNKILSVEFPFVDIRFFNTNEIE